MAGNRHKIVRFRCGSCGRYKYDKILMKPACPHCGGRMVRTSHAASPFKRKKTKDKKEPDKRRCVECNAILRSTNPNDICAPCLRNPGWNRR